MNHVAVEQLWVPPLVDGKSVSDVGSSLDGDQLGADPVGSWDAAVKASSASFGAPGALDGTVSLSRGPMPAADYCWEMTADALIHSWDLARGIGADDTLDAELVALDLRADPAPRRGARGQRHVREADPGSGRCAVADQAARGGGPSRVTDLGDFTRIGLADHGLCVLATLRPDTTIQASVVNAGVLDHPVSGAPVSRSSPRAGPASSRTSAGNRV